MRKIKWVIGAMLAALTLSALPGCGGQPEKQPAISFETISFRDIPGVTAEEIAAIEALKETVDFFNYSMMHYTEAFFDDRYGEIRGFATLTSEWLSGLFGIPFVPKLVTWQELVDGFTNGEVDFTGTMAPTEERRKIYFMTDAIARRRVRQMRLPGSEPLSEIRKTRLPRYAFLEGGILLQRSSTFINEEFELVLVNDYQDTYELFLSGEVDALFAEGSAEALFDVFGGVEVSDILPMLYLPVSLMTTKPEFEPIISVVQKALDNGASHFLGELYNRGYREYLSHKLFMQFTDEELEYINTNPVIPFAAEYDNYPISFFNMRDNEWQGICFDILREVALLTGLKFDVIHDERTNWLELLRMLESGEVFIISEMFRTPERENRFIWVEAPYLTDHSALLSRADFPDINIHDVLSLRVGLTKGVAHTDLFYMWFPDHRNTVEFYNSNDALQALVRGEVDLVMNKNNLLLHLTHYQELPGFKANIIFDNTFESLFGLNKDQVILRSIMEKALALIDTRVISRHWLRRTYDYRLALEKAQRPWIFGAFGLLLLILISTTFLLMKTIQKQKITSRFEYTNKLGKILASITKSPTISAGFLKEAADFITREGCAALNITRIGVWVATEKRDMLKSISCCLHNGEFTIQDDFDLTTCGKYAKLFETERLIVTNNVRTSEIWAKLVDDYNTNLCAILDVPIRIDGKLAGAVCLEQDYCEMFPKEREWTIEEQNFASSLADLMALAFSSTERRMARDAAVTANRAKTDFLATMSHEIRTPMNSIMGFAELAMDGAVEPQMKDYLSKITDSTRWLLRIINDILDISKVESGKMELENIPFDLHDIISRCQSVALPNIKEKGLELRVYAEPPIGKNILGDPIRLYQALINLLSNAIKFTSAGTIKLSSAIRSMDNGNATIYFEIKDSGIGMSPKQIKKIFEPFTQADSSTTRNYGGTGLGLTITKNIVEMMGGKLAVESTPGSGSTFSFEITFETVDASDSTINGIDYKFLEKPHFDGLILVCDDNTMNQQVACEHLLRVGLKTMVANNGKEAVDIVTKRMQKGEKPFDLILMDIFMPIMDGIEAASAITALDTGTPIVAMTANIMVDELEVYKKNGMPNFLGKPFTAQELWRILLKYLTPTSVTAVDNNEQTRDTDELLRKLQFNFVKNNQNLYNNIVEAITLGDLKLAHRLAHSLKGNSGQIGKKKLQNIAAEIEASLKDGVTLPTDEKMNQLRNELTLTLEELQQTLNKHIAQSEAKPMTAEQISALFEKIEPMLKNINPNVVNLLDDLRAIPGMEEFVLQVENYNFESAAQTLAKLKTEGIGGE
ncbi:MAG: transporter substrate-binding domain-containing protein [Chitinispirillales bacterium]|jgi:signal transduction histidine kinase/CheY-like chemotaxis protein/ABC-type amino acid transport substrate-binding protein|nr:transporter substrate-binding domain-containing protein [Chitinispirillales bacterium]